MGYLCQTGLASDGFVRRAATLAARLPGDPHVVLVFEDFQSGEVVEGDERRYRLAVAFEDNPLASIGHAVEGVAEGIPHRRGSQSGHGCTLPVSYMSCNRLEPTAGVTALRHVRFFGESVSVAEGISNPWTLIGQASVLLLAVFVVDVMRTVSRMPCTASGKGIWPD